MQLKSAFCVSLLALMSSACATVQSAEMTGCHLALELGAADETFPQSIAHYLDLLDCLGDSDPDVRDGFAYERLVDALRNRPPDSETRRAIAARLIQNLQQDDADQDGFLKPFSVLALAEVARTDRLIPYLSASERDEFVRIGTTYLRSVRDYRGFEKDVGWRHGVAHAADLMLQLSLNAKLGDSNAEQIFAAIETQIAPAGAHFYIFGEPRRLARPVLFLAMAGHKPKEGWTNWFLTFAADDTDPDWQSPYSSLQGLANLHNTRQFASTVLLWASENDDPKLAPLADGARAVLSSLP